MKNKWHLFLAFIYSLLAPSKGVAEDIYSMQHITLYNQQDIFSYRSPNTQMLATFIEEVNTRAAEL